MQAFVIFPQSDLVTLVISLSGRKKPGLVPKSQ